MINKINFKDKTIIVTGATRGIGKKISNDLYKLGANLLLTGTNKNEINILNKPKKNNIEYLHLDFLKENSVNSFLEDISKYKKIDGLVNNAGINRLNSIQNATIEDWNDILKVNLSASFLLINKLSKNMIKNSFGRIVNIGSIFGKISKEKRSIYSASKFGLHGLTVGSSIDLSKYNIFVNTISPGFVNTDLTRKNLSKEEINQMISNIPAGRLAETKDISSIVIYLLSDINSYITGQNIIVDGGFSNI